MRHGELQNRIQLLKQRAQASLCVCGLYGQLDDDVFDQLELYVLDDKLHGQDVQRRSDLHGELRQDLWQLRREGVQVLERLQ